MKTNKSLDFYNKFVFSCVDVVGYIKGLLKFTSQLQNAIYFCNWYTLIYYVLERKESVVTLFLLIDRIYSCSHEQYMHVYIF